MFNASLSGNAPLLKSAIKSGACVSTINEQGQTALHYAVVFQKYDCAEILIDAGTPVNVQDNTGRTPLHIVCNIYDNPIMVASLIRAGANVNIKDNLGNTPLHEMFLVGTCFEMAKALIEAGADVNATNHKGLTPLHYVINGLIPDCTTDILDLFIESGADLNISDINGMTALHFASLLGKVFHVKKLLKAGCSISSSTKEGYTPLRLSFRFRNSNVTRLLINFGAVY